jgi:2-phospho-L-lactate guanylyltransferase
MPLNTVRALRQDDSVFAVIPVKGFSESKSRLSDLFSSEDRARLVMAMLRDVVRSVSASKVVAKAVVISTDSEILELACSLGLEAIEEVGSGLNNAVEQATDWCVANGGDSVLVLPSDVPLIECEDVTRLVMIGSARNSIAISPSGDGGTNALMRSPPNVIPPRFGPKSFSRHIEEALNRGVVVNFYRSPRLALDIDSEEDLRSLRKSPNETMTCRLLEELGYARKLSPTL